MTLMLATTRRAALFCAVATCGTAITLPSPKVSFAAIHQSTSSAKPDHPRALASMLVGLRTQSDGLSRAEQRGKPYGRLVALNSREPHSGTLVYGSESISLPFDAETDTYAFGPMRLKHGLVKTIVHASYLAGVDPRLLMAIADKESSFIASARAPTSSATGLFQFIDGTWLLAMRDFGPRFGLQSEAAVIETVAGAPVVLDPAERERILNLRNDPFLSTLMAAAMLRVEQEKLAARLGRPISGADIYLVHFLGPAGAQKFLSVLAEKPKALAANLLPQAAKANRPIFYATRKRKPQSLSVAQVHEKIGASLERRLLRYRDLDFGRALAYAPAPAALAPLDDPFARWKL